MSEIALGKTRASERGVVDQLSVMWCSRADATVHIRQFDGHHWLIYRAAAQSREDFSLTKVSGRRIGWSRSFSIMGTPYAFGWL